MPRCVRDVVCNVFVFWSYVTLQWHTLVVVVHRHAKKIVTHIDKMEDQGGDAATARFRAAVVTRTVKMLSPEPTEAERKEALGHFDPVMRLRALREACLRNEELERQLAHYVQIDQPILKPRLPPIVALALIGVGAILAVMLRS